MNNAINDEYIKRKYIDSKNRIYNFSKINDEEKKYILSRFKDSSNDLRENLKRIQHNIEEIPICPICNENKCQYNKGGNLIYKETCENKKCINSLAYKKHKETLLKNHGVTNVYQLDSVKEKIHQTNIKRYGKNYKQKFANKSKQSCLDKYGVDNPMRIKEIADKVHQKQIEKYGSVFNGEKSKQTCLERYGVEYPAQNKEIYNKVKQTNLKKYGSEYIFTSYIGREKIKQTMIERYGVEHPAQNPELLEKIRNTTYLNHGNYSMWSDPTVRARALKASLSPESREKYKQTCLERYGVEYPTQNKEIYNKIKQTNLEKYGVSNTFNLETTKENAIKARQTPEAWEKYKKTCLEKYGTEFYAQCEKAKQNMSNKISSEEVQEKN